MNYNEALEYIHSFDKFGSKPGLERIEALLAEIGNPQNYLRIVHVAGTNGKGTVSTMLSDILVEDGRKTGLFTSPYVVDFCERMKLDGEMIPHDDLCALVEKFKPIVEKLNKKNVYPTEFELITAMAFYYFKESECDIAVMEVGLGGLYDSTNVVKQPEVSVITHIAYDHVAVLGNTIEEITLQKCGIIKENCPVVVYPAQEKSVTKIIEAVCKEKNSCYSMPDIEKTEILSSDIFGSEFLYDGEKIKISLAGYHQILNSITAYETAKKLGIEKAVAIKAMKNTVMPARVEVVRKNPLVILDGGHNADGAEALCKALDGMGKYVAVVSMMEDKDVDESLSYLLKNAGSVVATQCSNPRAMKSEKLSGICKKYCDEVFFESVPENAIDKALSLRKDDEFVVICGSLYLAGDIRKYIKE